jgi:hypothetical protein
MKSKSLFASFSSEKEAFFFEKKNQKTFVFRAVVILTLLASGATWADPVTPPSISPPDTWVQRTGGELRVLNKLDSTVQTLTLKVGETATLQTLSITLLACAVRPDDLPEDATAHLKVVDGRPEQPGFDGWILQREPGINMFEHPVYDIQLAGCN